MPRAKGVRLPHRTARLVFDGDWQGLEVVVARSVSLGAFLGLLDRIALLRQHPLALLEEFARLALVSWNLLDEQGRPIPATGDGIRQIEVALALKIVAEWQQLLLGPPGGGDEALKAAALEGEGPSAAALELERSLAARSTSGE